MNRIQKILISSFIVFNFLIMFRVHLPLQNRSFLGVFRPVDQYLSFLSLYQSWNMFAPNPARTNVYISAEVEFEDGSKDTFTFPKPTELSLGQKYVYGERYRVVMESIRKDVNSFLWQDTAKFALRKLRNSNFDKIPHKVHLYRHWNEIPDVREKFLPHLTKNAVYHTHKFFTYEVF